MYCTTEYHKYLLWYYVSLRKVLIKCSTTAKLFPKDLISTCWWMMSLLSFVVLGLRRIRWCAMHTQMHRLSRITGLGTWYARNVGWLSATGMYKMFVWQYLRNALSFPPLIPCRNNNKVAELMRVMYLISIISRSINNWLIVQCGNLRIAHRNWQLKPWSHTQITQMTIVRSRTIWEIPFNAFLTFVFAEFNNHNYLVTYYSILVWPVFTMKLGHCDCVIVKIHYDLV